jgi:4-amino-4-deoxy-L-arabinose transferase-like glycosyltransferase
MAHTKATGVSNRRCRLPAFPGPFPLALVATLLILLVHLPTLTIYPPVHVDDSWLANIGWNRMQTGDNYSTLDVGPFPSGKGVGSPPIASAARMWSYRFLGLGLFQTRLPSLFCGGILLLATYFMGKQLYSPRTGLLALLLLGLSWSFLESSHLGRPDIILAAFVVTALSFALWGMRSQKVLPNAAAGIIAALSAAVHQNGALLAVALGMVYLARYGLRFWRHREVWAFVAGGVMGSLYPGGLMGFARGALRYLLPSPQAGASPGQVLSYSHRPPVAGLEPMALLVSLVLEVHRYHAFDYPEQFLILLTAFLFVLIRRSQADRLLVTFMISGFFLFVLFVDNKEHYYAILFFPFAMTMLAEMFVGLVRDPKGTRLRRALVGCIFALFLLSSLQRTIGPVVDHLGYDYYAVTDRIRTVVPQGVRVLGRPTWWLGLPEYDYRSTFSLAYYDLDGDLNVAAVLGIVRPDVIIVDDGLRQGHLIEEDDPPRQPMFYRFFKYPRQEFESFLAQRGEKMLEFTDPWHGLVEVYAVHWD